MTLSSDALAVNIRSMRARLDMSQGALTDKIGANIGTIVQYESGSMVPGADKLFALARALGCTPNGLLSWHERIER